MPRPDKRFIRHPRPGGSEPSGESDGDTSGNPPRNFVKGRYATVPRPAEAPPAAEAPSPPVTAPPVPNEQVTKYDRRAGGAPGRPVQSEPETVESSPDVASEPEATEVVVDLRDSPTGFEAVYLRRPIRTGDEEG